MSQWVQSKYGKDAKKWEVCTESEKYYNVKDGEWTSSLLKDEYIIADPPERWETCMSDVIIDKNYWGSSFLRGAGSFQFQDNTAPLKPGYRWVRSEKDPEALTIQRKVTK